MKEKSKKKIVNTLNILLAVILVLAILAQVILVIIG